MTPDPITPDRIMPVATWCKLGATILGGISVMIGVVVGAVNYLVDAHFKEIEDEIVEISQAAIDDDIEWQDRRIELIEKRLDRLEDE